MSILESTTDAAPPEGYATFWDAVDRELAATPGRPTLEVAPERTCDGYTLSKLRITGIGPYRLFGYYSVPSGEGPFPALLETPKYGSVNHVPHHNDRLRYAVLTIMHRGQRLADTPFVAPYPGLLTLGIEDPDTYIYRAIVADCLRAAEFLLERPEVNPKRVAIQGDDLALITAARRTGFSLVRYAGPLLYRAMEARQLSSAYPIEELNDLLRFRPATLSQVTRSLSFLDPLHHAPAVRAEPLVSVGQAGTSGGEDFLAPLLDALPGRVVRYPLTFRGRTDHDRLDALMAERLGVPAMSQFAGEVG